MNIECINITHTSLSFFKKIIRLLLKFAVCKKKNDTSVFLTILSQKDPLKQFFLLNKLSIFFLESKYLIN